MSNKNKKINLHFITNSDTVYLWQYEMILSIASLSNVSKLTFSLFDEIDSSVFPSSLSVAYSLDKRLANCQTLLQETKSIDNLGDQIIYRASALDLCDESFIKSHFSVDKSESLLIINLTESRLPECLYRLETIQVISLFFSRLRNIHSTLTGILEFTDSRKSIHTGVQLETAVDQENIVLYEAEHSLESASLCRTLETVLHKTALFLPHVLQKYSHYSDKALALSSTLSLENPEAKGLSISEQLKFFAKFSARVVYRFWYRFTEDEQWIMMLAKNNQPNTPNMAFESFQRIMPPKDEFWADPFLIEHAEKHYLFFEVFPFERGLGHLSCMEVMDDGRFGEVVKILETPYHFSYPNVFEFEKQFYMVPETGGEQRIELYKAKSFPYEWEHQYNLMEGIRAYDSTFIEYGGVWWLFATVSETEQCATTEELHLFFADSPLSQDWTPHPANPINTFASSARPAGKIFKEGKKLYRPSQDCAGSYGAGVNIFEIVTLNKDEYEEVLISKRKPDWDKSLIGLHTLNFDSKYSVIDVILNRGFLK